MSASRFQKPAPAMPAPTHQDRLSAHLVECDGVAREMENKWGVGRLPALVSAATLLRFKAANDVLTATISAGDDGRIPAVAAMMARAWRALDAEATQRGALPLSPLVWETLMPDGSVLAIVRTGAEAHSVAADGREVTCYTLEEIARLMPQFKALNAIKLEFPGAAVLKVVNKRESFAQDFATSDEFMEFAHGESAP